VTSQPGTIFHKGASQAVTTGLKNLTRQQFRLSDDDIVMVTELACLVPGCPPLETVFAFWPAGGQRRQFKIFKPAGAVEQADLPPWWMKDALILPDWIDCECC
jgi:nitrate reductase delta subunit